MKSALMQKIREERIALYKRMTPEERLEAFCNHSQLVMEMYLAGVRHRAAKRPQRARDESKRRLGWKRRITKITIRGPTMSSAVSELRKENRE